MTELTVPDMDPSTAHLLQSIADFHIRDQEFLSEIGKAISKAYGPAEKEVIGETFYCGRIGTHDSIDYEGK